MIQHTYFPMSDIINPTGAQARKIVNMNMPDDVIYWTRKWNITKEQLQNAVERAGTKEARVLDYLRSKGTVRF